MLPFFTSCSNEDDIPQNKTDILSGEYKYKETIEHIEYSTKSKDNYSALNKVLTTVNTIEYTVGSPFIDEYSYSKDLCENTEHEHCTDLCLSFNGNKCTYIVKTYKVIQNITRTTETIKYTFKEGGYMFYDYGGYFGADVYPHGIYRTVSYSTSSVCMVALDGNFGYDLTYTSYRSSTKEDNVNIVTEIFDYTVNENIIYMHNDNKSITALKTENGITITHNDKTYYLN